MKTGFSLCSKFSQGKHCSGPVLTVYGIAVNVFNIFVEVPELNSVEDVCRSLSESPFHKALRTFQSRRCLLESGGGADINRLSISLWSSFSVLNFESCPI